LQWLEGNIPPQVVFEIPSPGTAPADLIRRFKFFESYGVEELYLYDPEADFYGPKVSDLGGWTRANGEWQAIPQIDGWVSPRLQLKFELVNADLRLYEPGGKDLASYFGFMEQPEEPSVPVFCPAK
jgi:Uma2 family endonuclease